MPEEVQLSWKMVLDRYMDEGLPEFAGMELRDVNQVSLFGDYPVNVAAWRRSLPEIQALLAGGANVNQQGEEGATPLHVAVQHNDVPLVRWLLDRGALTSIPNREGDTPLALAEFLGFQAIASELARHRE